MFVTICFFLYTFHLIILCNKYGEICVQNRLIAWYLHLLLPTVYYYYLHGEEVY